MPLTLTVEERGTNKEIKLTLPLMRSLSPEASIDSARIGANFIALKSTGAETGCVPGQASWPALGLGIAHALAHTPTPSLMLYALSFTFYEQFLHNGLPDLELSSARAAPESERAVAAAALRACLELSQPLSVKVSRRGPVTLTLSAGQGVSFESRTVTFLARATLGHLRTALTSMGVDLSTCVLHYTAPGFGGRREHTHVLLIPAFADEESLDSLVCDGDGQEVVVGLLSPTKVPVYLKMLTGKTTTLYVNVFDSIASFHEKVDEAEGIPVDQQRIIFAGRQLEYHRTLADYGITEGACAAPAQQN